MSSSGVINTVGTPVVTSVIETTALKERQIVSEGGNALPPVTESAETRTDVAQAVRDISEYVQSMSRELQFQLDENSDGTIITVRDADTREVVRQIPSEEVIAIARYIEEFAPDPLKGLLVDGRG